MLGRGRCLGYLPSNSNTETLVIFLSPLHTDCSFLPRKGAGSWRLLINQKRTEPGWFSWFHPCSESPFLCSCIRFHFLLSEETPGLRGKRSHTFLLKQSVVWSGWLYEAFLGHSWLPLAKDSGAGRLIAFMTLQFLSRSELQWKLTASRITSLCPPHLFRD